MKEQAAIQVEILAAVTLEAIQAAPAEIQAAVTQEEIPVAEIPVEIQAEAIPEATRAAPRILDRSDSLVDE